MTETSARLGMPYLMAAQAQKHVTHNQAIERLDALVQLTVAGFDASVPPASPVEGEVWALGPAPVNDWAGQGGRLAVWSNGGWFFVQPGVGWRATMATELRLWDGSAWVFADLPALQGLDGVGIGTSWDPINRLAVAAQASLFSHDGAGHQIKVNKAAAGDTASVLFQTAWSGRAELGTAGTDDFSVKVSADGTAWTTALVIDGTGGQVSFDQPCAITPGTATGPGMGFSGDVDTGFWQPGADQIAASVGGATAWTLSGGGLEVDVPIIGAAVQSDGADVGVPSRLVRTDGAAAAALSTFGVHYDASANRDIDTVGPGDVGLYSDGNPGTWPLGGGLGLWWVTTQRLFTGDATLQEAVRYSSTGTPVEDQRFFRLRANDGTWGGWRRLQETRGSGPNGSFVRFPDGLQICEQTLNLSGGGGVTITGVWIFPAPFIANPCVQASLRGVPPAGTRERCYWFGNNPSVINVNCSLNTVWPASTSEPHSVMAIGYWK